MFGNKQFWTWSMLRYGLVMLTLGVVTIDYYLFSHFVHQPRHFKPPDGNSSHFKPPKDDPSQHGQDDHDHGHRHDHEHGREGSFDNIHLKKDGLFLYGLALPLLLLTLASVIWNPSSSTKDTTTKYTRTEEKGNAKGDINVKKWTIICFVLPLFLIMLDGASGHGVFHSNNQDQHFGWNLYVRICMSLMSPSGYAACWSLALFLIPVTKHSPILDWLRVTPVQALAFHRVAGWTGFWNSALHGFLHLRHLMDVLNPQRVRPWYEQLRILLIPESWKCFGTQNPFTAFLGYQDPFEGTNEEANQCWLALVNLTGMVSVIAYVLLAITSLPQIRRYSYALFYSVHIPSAWIMLFTAIWHYPTCALVLIPNIIYYLSFNIPVYVTQYIENWGLQSNSKHGDYSNSSSLVEANLIQGGSIELVFAANPEDNCRHESRFARLFCPLVSPLSHPFSIFSRHDLLRAGDDDSSSATLSILLRPKGPFTENMTKIFFPNQVALESSNEDMEDLHDSISRPLIASPLPCKIQVDSYYASSFDWINCAMKSHDEILLVAGGVGIVPFLEFLPSLQQRIQMDAALGNHSGSSLEDGEALLESNERCGPSKIHLHWYCREVGLATYVWKHFLRHHVQEAWEKNATCSGILQVHLHLTKSDPIEVGEAILERASNKGLVEKQSYSNTNPVKDARFTQSLCLGLLLPGLFVLTGTILHWWWYKEFIVNGKYRHDNLIIRTHSIIFSLVLSITVSVLVEKYARYHDNKMQAHYAPSDAVTGAITSSNVELQNESMDSEGTGSNSQLMVVTGGRPYIEDVISDVVDATRPGVYSCGPLTLMESVEDAIRRKRSDCAFYREDSEM